MYLNWMADYWFRETKSPLRGYKISFNLFSAQADTSYWSVVAKRLGKIAASHSFVSLLFSDWDALFANRCGMNKCNVFVVTDGPRRSNIECGIDTLKLSFILLTAFISALIFSSRLSCFMRATRFRVRQCVHVTVQQWAFSAYQSTRSIATRDHTQLRSATVI